MDKCIFTPIFTINYVTISNVHLHCFNSTLIITGMYPGDSICLFLAKFDEHLNMCACMFRLFVLTVHQILLP